MGSRAFPTEKLSRLTLGTAQLGLEYGIANCQGCPDEKKTRAILDAAWREGIACLDTAHAYGKAEERIGAWCKHTGNRPLVISKLPPLHQYPDPDLEDAVLRYFSQSCLALGVTFLDGYLVHRADDLHRPGVAKMLRALCSEGKLGAFGTSVYTAGEIDHALQVPGLSLVQAPINIFDRRVVDSGAVARCHSQGVLVFARSIFWQGVFSLSPDDLPEYLQEARCALEELGRLAGEAGYDVATLALVSVRDIPGVAFLVIGVDCVEQLLANARAVRLPPLDDGLLKAVMKLGKNLPEEVLNPSLWPAKPF